MSKRWMQFQSYNYAVGKLGAVSISKKTGYLIDIGLGLFKRREVTIKLTIWRSREQI